MLCAITVHSSKSMFIVKPRPRYSTDLKASRWIDSSPFWRWILQLASRYILFNVVLFGPPCLSCTACECVLCSETSVEILWLCRLLLLDIDTIPAECSFSRPGASITSLRVCTWWIHTSGSGSDHRHVHVLILVPVWHPYLLQQRCMITILPTRHPRTLIKNDVSWNWIK